MQQASQNARNSGLLSVLRIFCHRSRIAVYSDTELLNEEES